MSEPLDSLVAGWTRHFAAADASIEWLAASERLETELAPGVWLVGELDARGRTSEGMFFGEWKTAKPREKKSWKQVWRKNPQSLSYGVLVAAKWPECTRFTVRKAFKENVPTYDHAWFRYSEPELAHWRQQLIQIAQEIDEYQRGIYSKTTVPAGGWKNWPTNYGRCFRYGEKYVCPFFECACSKLQWDAVPAGSTTGGDPEWSATQQRAAILTRHPHAIVLSPTTVVDWLDCREMYRRKYVQLVAPPKNEALVLGGQFHDSLAQHYAGLISAKETVA